MDSDTAELLKEIIDVGKQLRIDNDTLKSKLAQLIDENTQLLASLDAVNIRVDEIETYVDEHSDIIAQSKILEDEYNRRITENNDRILEADYTQISETWKEKLGITDKNRSESN